MAQPDWPKELAQNIRSWLINHASGLGSNEYNLINITNYLNGSRQKKRGKQIYQYHKVKNKHSIKSDIDQNSKSMMK